MNHLSNLDLESGDDILGPMNFGLYGCPLRVPLILMILGAAFVRYLIVLMDFSDCLDDMKIFPSDLHVQYTTFY